MIYLIIYLLCCAVVGAFWRYMYLYSKWEFDFNPNSLDDDFPMVSLSILFSPLCIIAGISYLVGKIILLYLDPLLGKLHNKLKQF